MPDPVALLAGAYGDLSAVLSTLTVDEGWEPTGCAGWTPVDPGFDLLSDARRALVALNSPAAGPRRTCSPRSPSRRPSTTSTSSSGWRGPVPRRNR